MYKYKVHILNRDINFDPNYKNVVQFFDPITKTKDYTGVFTNDELTFTDSEEVVNFDLKDAINATLVVDFTNDSVLSVWGVNFVSINEALNRQYCIIKESLCDDETEAEISSKLYFYFMKNPTLKNNNLVKYNLILDVFTTYPLFSDVEVDKTKIQRAHIDRFTIGSTANSAHALLNNKYLNIGEEIDNKFIKVNKNKIPVKLKFYPRIEKTPNSEDLSEETIKNILNSLRWLYVEKRDNNKNTLYFGCDIPLKFNEVYNIQLYTTSGNTTTNAESIDTAESVYNSFAEDPKVINAFISPLSPFATINSYGYSSIIYDYSTAGGNEYLKIYFNNHTQQSDTSIFKTYYYENKEKNNIISVDLKYGSYFDTFLTKAPKAFLYEGETIEAFNNNLTLSNYPFNYDTIKDAEIKTKIRQCYNEFILKTEIEENNINVDLGFLKTNQLNVELIQDMKPTTNGNVYITINNLYNLDIGAHIKGKATPQFYSDKYLDFVASNKNFALTGMALPIIKDTAGAIVGGAVAGGAYGAIIGAGVGLAESALKVHANMDNIRNTPDAIKRKGESIENEKFINNYPIYFIHTQLRDEELKQVNLYFYQFGYAINDIEDLSNFFTRSSFNYIQLEEDCKKDIHALLNESILDTICTALTNGVRFWTKEHYNNYKFNYDTNNLESKLL